MRTIVYRGWPFEIEDAVPDLERPIERHAVVTLGYHRLPNGSDCLLWATQDGRLHKGTAMSLFPILDQSPEQCAAALAFRQEIVNRYAKEPMLL
jgi:hypothetical protein